MKTTDLLWLAGLLEGEGSFSKGPPTKPNEPIIVVSMTDEDVVQRVASLFGVGVLRVVRGKEKGHKPVYIARLRGSRAVLLMQKLRALMGLRRTAQIDAAVACYKEPTRKLNIQRARRIRRALAAGITPARLAKRFRVSHSMVRAIRDNEAYKER